MPVRVFVFESVTAWLNNYISKILFSSTKYLDEKRFGQLITIFQKVRPRIWSVPAK